MVAPKLPELVVASLSCWEVAEFAAGVVLGLLVLCEELSCPDSWDEVVAAGGVALDPAGVVPGTRGMVEGAMAAGDGDTVALAVDGTVVALPTEG